MNVLSLFDGMSCGQIALNRAGIKYNKYFASEVDKYAIQITQKNYPDTIQLGDVREVKGCNLPKIDLLIGGSPCQGFSFAGKQLNFEDPRSRLFFEYVRLLKQLKPKYFLLENVKMKKEYIEIISNKLGVNPVLINSRLVCAQNRSRLYWTNINNILQPIDKKIVLRDILEKDVDSKYYLSNKIVSGSLTKKGEWGFRFNPHGPEDKAYCLTARYYKCGKTDPYIDMCKVNQINPSKEAGNKQPYMQNRVFHTDGKSHSLTASFASRTNIGKDMSSFRRLTPIECERLQTVPDNYTKGVSNTQRYKMLGNGWTVDVIVHILKGAQW